MQMPEVEGKTALQLCKREDRAKLPAVFPTAHRRHRKPATMWNPRPEEGRFRPCCTLCNIG